MNTLNAIVPLLVNPYTGTLFFVIAIGYCVRATPIANKWIPLIGIITGSVFFLVVAPITMTPDPNHTWNWYVLMWGVGVVISAFAWLIHLLVISKIEDYFRQKIPGLDRWFEKTSDEPTTNNQNQK